MAFVAYYSTSCPPSYSGGVPPPPPPFSTLSLLPYLRMPSFSSSSFKSSPRTIIPTAASARSISMVSATSLSFFPSTIFLDRGRGRDLPFLSLSTSSFPCSIRAAAARNTNINTNMNTNANAKPSSTSSSNVERKEGEVEEEEDLPWIHEKALDLVEFTGSVTQAIPGPRVGRSSLPWILAIPLAYVVASFLIALLKTVRSFNSPKAIRRKLVNKNAMLCKSIDELLEKGINGVHHSTLEGLMQKTGFGMGDILRKYIRYALNEKPFNPDLVAKLIKLRKASSLDDSQAAEILNEISRRIVKDKGPVVMDMSGYSDKGFKRKLAVQTLFGKVYYLSELPEFCSRDNSLIVKEIFGVADEDAEKLRMYTHSELGDVDLLERMIDDGSDSEEYYGDGSSSAP